MIRVVPAPAISGGVAPLILGQDFVDGVTTGVEGNAGWYLTVYGVNFGTFANLGTSAGARVYIGGQEVANYRVLDTNTACTAGGSPQTIQRIICQVGSSGVQGLTVGTQYQLKVVVNGLSPANSVDGSNFYLDLDGKRLSFTPITSDVFFVDETNGADGNAGTMASPKQHIQTYPGSGSSMTGILASNDAWNSGTQTGGVKPGTGIVLRTGTYVYAGSFQARWANFFRVTGTDPTSNGSGGGVGVNNGYLKVTSYPGPILGNAPETAFYNQPTQATNGGGFNGNDSARAAETTPFGFTGYAKYIAVSRVKIALSSGTANDAAPFNHQTYADHWRINDCEMTYPSTVTGANHARAGGITGSAAHCTSMFNYIHDIGCDAAFLENHGFYLDGSVIYATDYQASFNYIKNVTGGSGFQVFNSVISGNDSLGNAGFTNLYVHHNVIDTAAKYGLNIADSNLSGLWYGNLVKNTTLYAVRLNTNLGSTNLALTIMNNTLYGCDPTGTGLNAMITNESSAANGYVELRDNIICLGQGRSGTTETWYVNNGASDAAFAWTSNLYFDPDGHQGSAPSGPGHTGELYGDPKFATPYTVFSLLASSPAIGAATTSSHLMITYDLNAQPQPRAGQASNSIGAYA